MTKDTQAERTPAQNHARSMVRHFGYVRARELATTHEASAGWFAKPYWAQVLGEMNALAEAAKTCPTNLFF